MLNDDSTLLAGRNPACNIVDRLIDNDFDLPDTEAEDLDALLLRLVAGGDGQLHRLATAEALLEELGE